MIKVGITGGIGSGKSTVCEIFRLLGIPVFVADQEAKILMNSNAEVIEKLIHLFGKDIYTENRILNRKKLAEIIFNNDIQREMVNQIVHPAVRTAFMNWIEKQDSPYIIHEAAILFESGFYKMMDYTLLVTAPEEMRIERVMKRDGIETKSIKDRMEKQWPDSEKRKLASFELVNDNRDLIIPQIIKIDENLRLYGKIW
jgi:dephospho-CoA kinase